MQIETFTWLASYPKSGNTWLRMLISAYYQNGFLDINYIAHSTGDNISFWTQQVSPLPIAAMTNEQIFALRSAALFAQLCSSNKNKNFTKTHHANMRFNDSARLIPLEFTARAVYVIRDPRDVAVSMATYLQLPLEHVVENMANPQYGLQSEGAAPHCLNTWSTHVQSWQDEKAFPVAFIRYEDMLSDPVKEFTQFLEFCQIPVDKKRVIKAVDACRLHRLQKQEKESGFREDRNGEADRLFFNKGGSRWKKELPDDLVAQIEHDHREMMERYGYLKPAQIATQNQ